MNKTKQPTNQNIQGMAIMTILRTASSLTSKADAINKFAANLVSTNPEVAKVKDRLDGMMNDLATRCNELPTPHEPGIQSKLKINGKMSKGVEFELPEWRQTIFTHRLYARRVPSALKRFGFTKAPAQEGCILVLKDKASKVKVFLVSGPNPIVQE
jgi:hypothetical protein